MVLKAHIGFIDDSWYGRAVGLDHTMLYKIDGQSAMNMLFEQADGGHNNIVILHAKVGDVLRTSDSSLQVDFFTSDEVVWHYVLKQYLMNEVL